MDADLEAQIDQWRAFVARQDAISSADVEEMESHLRDQVADLGAAGLSADEAFLVGVKRMGNVDAISREFAREHSERLWKQLMFLPADDGGESTIRRELAMVLGLAVAAGLAVRIGLETISTQRLPLNLALLVLPFLAGFFLWKRQASWRVVAACAVTFAVAAVAVNVYPFESSGPTEVLAITHTPVALWFAVGFAYVGGSWRSGRHRMDFIRFTGEWVVYMALLALGGIVLVALTVGSFNALGVDAEPLMEDWVPSAAAGAVVVAAWLVESKQNVVENIAPVLTKVFTPLATVMLMALLVAFLASTNAIDVDRTLLILVDLILILVLGLLLYAISARDPLATPDLFDRLQLALVVTALAVDALMLAAMVSRIAEFGFTANKVAALGLNVVLLVNLARSAWLSGGFVRGRRPFSDGERWQTTYLPMFGLWAAVVVVVLSPAFGFA